MYAISHIHRPTTVRQAAGLLAKQRGGEAPRRRAHAHSDDEAAAGAARRTSSTCRQVEGLSGIEAEGPLDRDRRDDAGMPTWPTRRCVNRRIAGARRPCRHDRRSGRCAIAARSAARSPTTIRTPTIRRPCLGLGATIITNKRRIAADDFFTGMFETALEDGEIITKVQLPDRQEGGLREIPKHPASRFALVGVFVSKRGSDIRVAVTGAGASGVFRVQVVRGGAQEALRRPSRSRA